MSANYTVFSNVVTLYISGKVKKPSVIIWGTEQSHNTSQYIRDISLNVICILTAVKFYAFFLLNIHWQYAPLHVRRGARGSVVD